MAENNLENRVNSLETKFEVFVQEMKDFKDEMRDFRTEMRQQNVMRAAEIARVDEKIEKLREQREKDMRELAEQREKDNAKHEADMKEINQKIDDKVDSITKEIRTMSITMILGVGAIMTGVMGVAWAMFGNNNSTPPVQVQTPPAQTTQIKNLQ